METRKQTNSMVELRSNKRSGEELIDTRDTTTKKQLRGSKRRRIVVVEDQVEVTTPPEPVIPERHSSQSPHGVDEEVTMSYATLYNEMNMYTQILDDCRPFYRFQDESSSPSLSFSLPPRLDDALEEARSRSSSDVSEEDASV